MLSQSARSIPARVGASCSSATTALLKTTSFSRCASRRLSDTQQGIANGLDGMFAVAVAAGDIERAGILLGAAEELRERKGLLGPAMLPYHQQVLAQVEASPAADGLQIAREQGRHADIAEVVEEALS